MYEPFVGTSARKMECFLTGNVLQELLDGLRNKQDLIASDTSWSRLGSFLLIIPETIRDLPTKVYRR